MFRLRLAACGFVAAGTAAAASTLSKRSPQIDCFYSLSSPWMYLAGPQLEDICHRHNAKLTLKPYDFQAVAPQNGGIPLRTRPDARKSYHRDELARWSSHLGLPLNLEPAHYKPNFAPGREPSE